MRSEIEESEEKEEKEEGDGSNNGAIFDNRCNNFDDHPDVAHPRCCDRSHDVRSL